MNPKVLSIFNNAKIFLSQEELKELALCIDKDDNRLFIYCRNVSIAKPFAKSHFSNDLILTLQSR